MSNYVLVDPQSVLSFSFDWSDWLDYGSPADTIATHQWTISPPNPGTPATPVLSNATSEIVTAEGFLAGRVYYLTDHVVTAAGLEDERTRKIRCENT